MRPQASLNSSKPIVLCALEYERRKLKRAGIQKLASVVCTGPGPAQIRKWANDHARAITSSQLVILAGLAGGLCEDAAVGSVWLAECALTEAGEQFRLPPWRWSELKSCTIVSTSSVVCTAEGKRDLHVRTGATLVDMEAAEFARQAVERGWRAAIIRAVSDGPDSRLPSDVGRWVNERGRAKPGALLRSLARDPREILDLLRLGRDAGLASKAMADALKSLLVK